MRIIMNDFQAMLMLGFVILLMICVYVIALDRLVPQLTHHKRALRLLAMIGILAVGAFLGIVLGIAGIIIDIALLGANGNPTTILVACMCTIGLLSTFIVATKRAPLPEERFRRQDH